MQHYEVAKDQRVIIRAQLFQSPDVIPEWKLHQHGGWRDLLDRKVLVPTDKRQNVKCDALPAKTAEDPLPALTQECDRLARENREFAISNKELDERVKSLEAIVKRQEEALGKATAEHLHLEEACENHQKAGDEKDTRIAELEHEKAGLERDLDLATAPAGKRPKKAEPAGKEPAATAGANPAVLSSP